MTYKAEINKYAEIIWPDPGKELKKVFQDSSLITFDWYQMKYISHPTGLEAVEQIVAFAGEYGIAIAPYSKSDLSIGESEELVDHFFFEALRDEPGGEFSIQAKTPIAR